MTKDIEPTTADKLAEIADRIAKRGGQFVIDTGNDLLEAKKLLPHGRFQDWLKDEFDWSERTANNMMNAAKLADESAIISLLRPTAIYALSAPGTPKGTQAEIIADLEAGKDVSSKDVMSKSTPPRERPA